MTHRMRATLVALVICFLLIIAVLVAALTIFTTRVGSPEGSAAASASGSHIVADDHDVLSAPEPVRYEATSNSADLITLQIGSGLTSTISVAATTSGDLEITDDMLTQASLDITAEGYPAVSFVLTEPCYLGRGAVTGDAGSTAVGTLYVNGNAYPASVLISTDFSDSTGTVHGSATIPAEALAGVDLGFSNTNLSSGNDTFALPDPASGTIEFTLTAERFGTK
ncbi:hypothetical protein [Lysinibacter cavernae]|uniref:YceI family protein n=1 Tax=Lysinibacter cavernae TaxID=1640652 RepID=A0A7X5TT22_9MICO|nr:hypothetical protein [Lysinibacter cavernae]NIH53680.1 hypothetical protein [Lysinibacter cavernae]